SRGSPVRLAGRPVPPGQLELSAQSLRAVAALTPQDAPTTLAAPMSNPTPPTTTSDPARVPQNRRGGAHVVVSGLKKDFVHGGVLIPVLRGLTFELRPGEIASVVGASGVGKSTLLQVLGTLDAPTAGDM